MPPFSSVLGASSVIRPGVCTSTTRPTVPYEGQLIYETDTDRVASYNGSAWVYTATGALVVVKAETTFSAVSSVTCDNVFTSAYRNYRLVVNYTTSGGSGIRIRVRSGGTSVSTATYNEQTFTSSSTTNAGSRGANSTSVVLGFNTNGSFSSSFDATIYNPQVATATTFFSNCVQHDGGMTVPIVAIASGNNSNNTSYDGFELFLGSGTTTGNYTVYGLATS